NIERDRISDQEGNALALGDRCRYQRNGGMVGAEHGHDLSCVISRSVWFWPTWGLPWWSTLISSIFAPPRLGRPAVAARGMPCSSGCAVLTMSAPSSTASLADEPALAALPVSG